MDGEIIEQYPEDRPYPSCLICGQSFSGVPIHSVWAYNDQTQWVVLVIVSEGQNVMPFEKCPVCGGQLEEKEVEKLLRGGQGHGDAPRSCRSMSPLRREIVRRGCYVPRSFGDFVSTYLG
jgi:hypothetical protein